MSNKDKIPENSSDFTLEEIMQEFGTVAQDPDAPAESWEIPGYIPR